MSKRAPSTTQLLVITGFALSCFGILLFLWVTFGGPTPFRAKTYEVKVPFNEATQLAEQSDVRISGVNVGKVQKIELAPNGKQALATVDIDDQYAPLPESTRAILRTKTLLGETYIELTPGLARRPRARRRRHPAGGERRRIGPARRDLPHLQRRRPAPPSRNGCRKRRSRSTARARTSPTRSAASNRPSPNSTSSSASSTASASRSGSCSATAPPPSSALRGREGELADLIQSSNAVFQTTARRDRDIEALFRAFPTFLDESRLTFNRLKDFSLNADPLMRQLVPAAEELSPTLIAFSKLAPESKGFFEGLGPVIKRAPTGFAALRKIFRDEFPPLLRAVDPFLRNLNPILTGLKLYKSEVTSFFANLAATFNGELPLDRSEAGEPQPHYLRVIGPYESRNALDLSAASRRSIATAPTARRSGRKTCCQVCRASIPASARPASSPPSIPPTGKTQPSRNGRRAKPKAEGEVKPKSQDENAKILFERIQQYAFAGQTSTAAIAAPPCNQQAPFKPIYGSGPSTQYQHTFEQP